MTKIVNNLSAKMEFGAPMICMYLLCNPDHYTNHHFVPFYWQSYLHEARLAWDPKDTEGNAEKIALIKHRGCIVGLSHVYDYIYRPFELESMCLFDWVSRCSSEKLPDPKKKNKKCSETMSVDDEIALHDISCDLQSDKDTSDVHSQHNNSVLHTDILTPNKACYPEEKHDRETKNNIPAGLFSFLDKHPLHMSHGTRCVQENSAKIPNFIGATLPCCDQGDREYYCSAMLVLFR